MLKRITAMFLAFILTFNVFVGTIAVDIVPFKTVAVHATAVPGVPGVDPVSIFYNFALFVYGYMVVDGDIGQVVDVPDAPSEGVDIPGVIIPDGVSEDEFLDSYSVSEEKLEWVISGVYAEKFGGEKPDPNKDPRGSSSWQEFLLNLSSSYMLTDGAYSYYINQIAQCTTDVISILENGAPSDWWGYTDGDVTVSVGKLNTFNCYQFNPDTLKFDSISTPFSLSEFSLDGCIPGFFDSWNNGYTDSSTFVVPFRDYMGNFNTYGFLCSSPTNNAYVKNFSSRVHVYKSGSVCDFTVNGDGTKDISGYLKNREKGAVYFDHANNNVVGSEQWYKPNGNWYIDGVPSWTIYNISLFKNGTYWTNMTYDSATNRFFVPYDLNLISNFNYLNPDWVGSAIEGGYTPVSPDGMIYDTESGTEVPDWSNYDFLTKEDLYEILTNPEIYNSFANSIDVQNPDTGEIVENTNNIESDTDGILATLKTLPSKIWSKFTSTLTNMPKKIFSYFSSPLNQILTEIGNLVVGNLNFQSLVQNISDFLGTGTLSQYFSELGAKIGSLSFDSIIDDIKSIPGDVADAFSSFFSNIYEYLRDLPTNIYKFFNNSLSSIYSSLNTLSASAVNFFNDFFDNLDSFSVSGLVSSIAEGLKSFFVPSADDLNTIYDTAQNFFNKFFMMPKDVFQKLCIEGKDIPDVSITINGKKYVCIKMKWFNDFVEDFRPYIQTSFVILWMMWLANQFLSLFNKSPLAGGSFRQLEASDSTALTTVRKD